MVTTIAPITEGMSTEQAGRLADRFTTRCRKDGEVLPKDIVQDVLEQEGVELVSEMFEALRKRVERRSKMVVWRVVLNPELTSEQVIDGTGRTKYVNADVVETMPKHEGPAEVDVHFFTLGRFVSPDQLDAEYEARGLVPHPRAQAQVNTDDPSFADERPNGTQWRDDQGRACFLTFDGWWGERRMRCDRDDRDDGDWDGGWWFAGVRKSSK